MHAKDGLRFWSKVTQEGACWTWTAADDGLGYGAFRYQRKRVKAHRFAYEFMVGDIPEGLVLDHLCKNTRCVNPDHLEPVTQAENIRRGDWSKNSAAKRKAQTHCKRGHALEGKNLMEYNGSRRCRTCTVEATRRWRGRNHR